MLLSLLGGGYVKKGEEGVARTIGRYVNVREVFLECGCGFGKGMSAGVHFKNKIIFKRLSLTLCR